MFAIVVLTAIATGLMCGHQNVKGPDLRPGTDVRGEQLNRRAPEAGHDEARIHYWYCDVCLKYPEKNDAGDYGMEMHAYVPTAVRHGDDYAGEIAALVENGWALGLHQEYWGCSAQSSYRAQRGRAVQNPLQSGPPPPIGSPIVVGTGYPPRDPPYEHYCRDAKPTKDKCALEPGTGAGALREMGGILFYDTSRPSPHTYIFIPCAKKQGITSYDKARSFQQDSNNKLYTLTCTGTHTSDAGGGNSYDETIFRCE
jgi:hypothetical protein